MRSHKISFRVIDFSAFYKKTNSGRTDGTHYTEMISPE